MKHNCLEEVITATEADQLWGLGSGTVRRAIWEGRLTGRKSGGTQLTTITVMTELYGEPEMSNEVKIISDGCRCPVHGNQKGAEYKEQTAPCGCKWVWEKGKLIAVPKR